MSGSGNPLQDIGTAAADAGSTAIDAAAGNIPGAVAEGIVTAEQIVALVQEITAQHSAGTLTPAALSTMWQALGKQTESVDAQWQKDTGSPPVQ